MMMDQEMLLLLRKLEQKGVEFTAMLSKLELYNICTAVIHRLGKAADN